MTNLNPKTEVEMAILSFVLSLEPFAYTGFPLRPDRRRLIYSLYDPQIRSHVYFGRYLRSWNILIFNHYPATLTPRGIQLAIRR